MSHSVFISYSRRESPFVDILLDELEDEGVNVWVDYHCLIPAKPWPDQILEGIRQANVFLLVVSKASMASENVEVEYKHALEGKKRMILLIFEAVDLPPALQTCEWIDFRSSFGRKKRELLVRLDGPIEQPAPPQGGFRTSLTVWLTFFLSVFTLLLSIPAWWTFYIPALLIPLPSRILRRDFHFYRVRFAVLTLPIVLLLSWVFFSTYSYLSNLFIAPAAISFFTSPVLLLLLSSKGMRLWGKPIASAPRFANPYQPEVNTPQPVPFFIEHAPQDKKYADAIRTELANYGHPLVTVPVEAKANFVLLSRYKDSTALDPETQVVYPILIQDTPIEDKKL
ncbi:MAG TPA: TIR domain-containing protein, partial [Anaerolineales bacterium]|nr:TIR domain-containing protein [Anaerolineales bacterium]